MNKRIIYTTTISGILMLIMACSSPAQKVENAKEDLKDAKQELSQSQQDSVADFELFKKESNEKISDNEKAISACKIRMASNKHQVKTSDQKMIDELEQRNIKMRNKIADYKENKKDSWSKFREEFNHDIDEISNALKGFTLNETK